jgi:hypothetical protein
MQLSELSHDNARELRPNQFAYRLGRLGFLFFFLKGCLWIAAVGFTWFFSG